MTIKELESLDQISHVTERDLARFAREQLEPIMSKLEEKGQTYGGDREALQNFREQGNLLGITPEFDLMVQATKHWHSLVQWSKGRVKTHRELKERVIDIIVYMLLLLFLLEGREEQEK
jgi:hypothetical protein